MALGKYKSAARASRKYSKAITDVKKAGYGRDYAITKGEEQRSLYGSIGGSIANVIGIIDERKRLSQMEKYKQAAIATPGIVSGKEEYQPLGKLGKTLGISAKERTIYKDFQGSELPENLLYAIGYSEMMNPQSTKYGKYEAPVSEEGVDATDGPRKKGGFDVVESIVGGNQTSDNGSGIQMLNRELDGESDIDYGKVRGLIGKLEYDAQGGIVPGENWAQFEKGGGALKDAYKILTGRDLEFNIDPDVLAKDTVSYDKFVDAYIKQVSSIIGTTDPKEVANAWYSPSAYKKGESSWNTKQSKIFASRRKRIY